MSINITCEIENNTFNFAGFAIQNSDNLYRSYSTTLSNPKRTRQVRETLDKDGDYIDRSIEVRKIRDFDED